MSQTLSLPSGRVLVTHTSAAGPMITHVRGTLLASSIENLRSAWCDLSCSSPTRSH